MRCRQGPKCWSTREGASGSKETRVYDPPETVGSSAVKETRGSSAPSLGCMLLPSCTDAPDGNSTWRKTEGRKVDGMNGVPIRSACVSLAARYE